jgi:hypothetical protein
MKESFNENTLLSDLWWNNDSTFILRVHELDASSSGFKPGMFIEDSSQDGFFILHDSAS